MGLMRDLFGPSRGEIWRQLAEEIGADYVDGGFWKGDKVQASEGQWTITLDTFTESSGKHSQTYTRMRAPYVNADGFQFSIHREGFFSGVGRFFGMQDLEMGDPQFDEDFVLQGNNEAKVRELLQDDEVRRLLQAQPRVHIHVRDSEGWFGATFPDGVDELYFRAAGVIRDVEQLKALYALFSAVLNRLCAMGSAYDSRPGVEL